MWKMKTTAIPVVIGALGVKKKGMRSNIEKVSDNVNLEELQKMALLGTAHIISSYIYILFFEREFKDQHALRKVNDLLCTASRITGCTKLPEATNYDKGC